MQDSISTEVRNQPVAGAREARTDAGKRTRSERLQPRPRPAAVPPTPAMEGAPAAAGVAPADDPFGLHLAGSAAPRPTLRQGMRSSDVAGLQSMLVGRGASIAVDGAFGPATAAAVRQVQRDGGLAADGVVGPRTWALLDGGGATAGQSAAPAVAGKGGGPGGGAATGGAARRGTLLALVGQVQARMARMASPAAASAGSEVAIEPAPRNGMTDDEDGDGGIGDQLLGAIGGAVEQVGGAVGGEVEQVGGAVEGVVEQVGGAVDAAIDGAGEVLTAAGEARDRVSSTIAGWTDGLRERYAPELDALTRAIGELGRPLTADIDLDAIEATLRRLADLFDPGALLNQQATDGGVTFEHGEVKKSEPGHSATDGYAFQTWWNGAGEGGIGSVTPSTPTLSGDKYDSARKLTAGTFKISWTHKVAKWNEHAAAHPLEQRYYEEARGTMIAHEDGHVDIDKGVYSTANVAACVGMTRSDAMKHIDTLTAKANAENASYDGRTGHGVDQSSSTSTHMRMPTKAEKDEYDKTAKEKSAGDAGAPAGDAE